MPLLERFPDQNAGIEEFRAWACDSREWAISMSKGEKKRRRQLAKLRNELKIKNAAFERYKKEIANLESQIAEYEESLIFKLWMLIKRMVARGQINE
jgi:chromosome segregation ATPase